MKKIILLGSALAAASLLSGCATIVSGSDQTVSVQAVDQQSHKPIKGASCALRTMNGMSYVVHGNPGATTLLRDSGSLTLKCEAPAYYQKSIATGTSFNAWTLGNVIFWPGAIVDVATGAYKKYPSHITVVMSHDKEDSHKKFTIKKS